MQSKRFKWILIVLGVGLFAAFACLWLAGRQSLYFNLLSFWGVDVKISPYMPFVDIEDYFAAYRCHYLGWDVFRKDPCDLMNRVHFYPVWFLPHVIDFGKDATPLAGTCLALLFLGSFVALVCTPRGWSDFWVYAIAMFSPTCALAVERANLDLLVFILLVLAASFLSRAAWWRAAGYSLILFGASLKFYPMAAMGLALREKIRPFLLVIGGAAILALGFVLLERGRIAAVSQYLTDFPPLYFVFGGPASFKYAETALAAQFPSRVTQIRFFVDAAYILAILLSVLLSFYWMPKFRRIAFSTALDEKQTLQFWMGSLIVTATFFAGMNLAYRGIFLLLLLPWLLSRRQLNPTSSFEKYFPYWSSGIILLLLWVPFITQHLMYRNRVWVLLFSVFVRDPLWWLFVTFLLSLLWLQLAVSSPLIKNLRAGFSRD
jgi:hypothetical protein